MTKVLHLYPSLFKVDAKPLADKWLPEGGPWYAGPVLKLSTTHTAHVIFNERREVHLVVVSGNQATQSLLVATFERLEGAYEKTTNSWLRELPGGWELVTSSFLNDFEQDQNITGQSASVSVFKSGRFEFKSTQLPAGRTFPLQK